MKYGKRREEIDANFFEPLANDFGKVDLNLEKFKGFIEALGLTQERSTELVFDLYVKYRIMNFSKNTGADISLAELEKNVVIPPFIYTIGDFGNITAYRDGKFIAEADGLYLLKSPTTTPILFEMKYDGRSDRGRKSRLDAMITYCRNKISDNIMYYCKVIREQEEFKLKIRNLATRIIHINTPNLEELFSNTPACR